MTSHAGSLYVTDNDGDDFWLINVADPSDETGDFGRSRRASVTGLFSPSGMTSHAGGLYVADATGDELWRINPADPDDEAGGLWRDRRSAIGDR